MNKEVKEIQLRNTAFALGICTVIATSLSILKVNKNLVIGSTAVVVAGLIIALRNEDDLTKNGRNYAK